ncbi:MAG: YraN family protein [SAR202 cluster bacterium]|nr:YraN family protein [SAR202 cluster bacterium]
MLVAMPDNRRLLGQQGEALARVHLEQDGYVVRDTNYRCLWGEVDIIVEKNDEIVFVEVRTRRSKRFGSPEESVTALKRKHLVSTAYHYIEAHDLSLPWRIDLIAIDVDAKGIVERLEQLENIVEEDGLSD